MFWEWLERTLYGVVAALLSIVIIAVVLVIGALWLILYEAIAWFAILVLIIFIGIPIVTLIYTIYDNWFLVTEFFKKLRNKLK